MPETAEQLLSGLPQLRQADLIELRIDRLPDVDFREALKAAPRPLLITLRSQREGGRWKGSLDEQIRILQSAADAGVAYIDVEWADAGGILPRLQRGAATRLVLSCHCRKRRREELEAIAGRMVEIPADIYKLVFSAESLNDNLTALHLLQAMRARRKEVVIHAMGEKGRPSRLLGALQGNAWTYVSNNGAAATAPGQLSLDETAHFYALRSKRRDTKILGLVGMPVHHSKGWRLHNRLIEAQKSAGGFPGKTDFLYLNFPVEDLNAFWEGWNQHLQGISITRPYKESIIPFLSSVSREVRISGVCNTAVKTPDGWQGHNTDLIAIETLLRPHEEILRNGCLIIGTGATARSAVAALKRLGSIPIFMVGRNHERGQTLARWFGIEFLTEDELQYAVPYAVIQTTPVGMVPYVDESPVGPAVLRKTRLAFDVIYTPAETRFLRESRERGCTVISGEQMFLLQAARQFELFTGATISPGEVEKVWREIA